MTDSKGNLGAHGVPDPEPDHASGIGCPDPVEPVSVGSWEWDFSSGSMTWSEGVRHVLGLQGTHAVPSYERYLSAVHCEDRASVREIGQAAMDTGASISAEFRVAFPDGSVNWVACKGEVFRNAAGTPSWAAGVLFDVTEEREMRLELIARTERYRALATMSALGEWLATPDGEIVQCRFWTEFTGQIPEECRNFGWLSAVHPEDVEGVKAAYREALRIGSSMELRYRVRHHSGSYRWCYSRAVPIKRADGSIQEWIGSTEDIQSRHESETVARAHAERRRLALEAARMVAWDYDLESGYVTRSENAIEILGLGSGPIEEMHSYIHSEDRARVLDAIETMRRTGTQCQIDYRMVDRSGRTTWVRSIGNMLRHAYSGPDHIVGVTFDVTARKEAELKQIRIQKELGEQSLRLYSLAKVAGDFVWTSGPDGRVLDMPEWREFTGQSTDEVQGWGWLNVVHPADRERIRDQIQHLIDNRTGAKFKYRVRSRTGEYFWFLVRAAPVIGPDGTVREWIGVCEQLAGPEAMRAPGTDEPPLDIPTEENLGPISGCQVRAARAVMNWSVRDLANASGVSSSTIRRIEENDGVSGTRDTRKLFALRQSLEAAGVEFLPARNGKGGVRPK